MNRLVIAVYQYRMPGEHAWTAPRTAPVLVVNDAPMDLREKLAKAHGLVAVESLSLLTVIERSAFDERAINADDEEPEPHEHVWRQNAAWSHLVRCDGCGSDCPKEEV